MKITSIRALLALGLGVLLCGCTPTTSVGVLPAEIGPITFSATRIGTGQPVSASSPLPVGGENINTVYYFWADSETGKHNDSYRTADGVANFQFIASTTPGEYPLIFGGIYHFNTPDAKGDLHTTKTTKSTYTVVACDVVTSFWSDSAEETMRVVPGVKKDPNAANIYWITLPTWVPSSPGISSSFGEESKEREYHFTNNALTSIKDIRRSTYAEDRTAEDALRTAYVVFLGEQRYFPATYKVEPAEVQIFDKKAQTESPLNTTKLKDADYATPLGARLLNKEITLRLSYSWGTTNLVVTSWFDSPKTQMNTRDYTPKPKA